MRILVVGASGLLGKKCYTLIKQSQHEVGGTYWTNCISPGLKRLDITSRQAVDQMLRNVKPEVVIHAAALVNPDTCEKQKKMAWRINVGGTQNLTLACKRLKIKLIYISSDYVFDGTSSPYSETSPPSPVNFYGTTKLEGERSIQEELHDYAIVRPTALYGYNDKADTNFPLKVIACLRQGQKLAADNQLIKYPVLIDDVASLVKEIIENNWRGIFHVGGPTKTTYYRWAKQIARLFNLNPQLVTLSKSYGVAKRPQEIKLLTRRKKQLKSSPRPLSVGNQIFKMQQGCTFQLLYHSNPQDTFWSENVAQFRIKVGKALAKEYPARADVVIPIPESGIFPASGYAEVSGIPLYFGLIRDDRIRRTLFELDLEKRVKLINRKLIPLPKILERKHVVLIDEAILSGTTLAQVCKQLRKSRVREIHVRIPAPPIWQTCLAGMHPVGKSLFTQQNKLKTLREYEQKLSQQLKVTSVKHLSLASFKKVIMGIEQKCFTCFTRR